jgi:hypothetical protein
MYAKELHCDLDLAAIEDEDEKLQAYLDWIKDKIPKHYSVKPPKATEWEIRDKELRKTNPVYAELADYLKGDDLAESILGDEFVPTLKGWHKEMDRIESNIGRYPRGFRHYENYINYRQYYP